MHTPPDVVTGEGELRATALAELRKVANPFSTAVAAVGSVAENLQTDVRAHTEPILVA